ncbi:MAG: thioredoxin [Flavobacteriales bacterium]|nr:thioredoxin [Flavobacteriales bacterium]MCB9168523.1 thioredoxin [Flavobacteriales bacterium]
MSRFQEILNGPLPVLVDMHATWCGPCKALAPIIEEVARATTGRMRVLKVDVDRNPQMARQYQVRGVPTLLLFSGGKVVWRTSGVVPAGTILEAVRTHTAQ